MATETDHDNALMLCSHWATPDDEKVSISNVAARISSSEAVPGGDWKVYQDRLAAWEANATTVYYVGEHVFETSAEARDYARANGGEARWRRAWHQVNA